jgi:hypothetical protein
VDSLQFRILERFNQGKYYMASNGEEVFFSENLTNRDVKSRGASSDDQPL